MTIAHHPSEETLLKYAACTLASGPRLVIAAHLAGCPACRARVADYEALGGALLEETEPTALSSDALDRALARVEARDEVARQHPSRPVEDVPIEIDGVRLPDALKGCDVGRWRWIGPGMHMSRVGVPHDPGANLILLKIGAGRALPDHGHEGTEFTYVVSGSFSDELGRYGPGDLSEVDAEVEHEPRVDPQGECICLAAIDGRMRFNGFIARMLQPVFGV